MLLALDPSLSSKKIRVYDQHRFNFFTDRLINKVDIMQRKGRTGPGYSCKSKLQKFENKVLFGCFFKFDTKTP